MEKRCIIFLNGKVSNYEYIKNIIKDDDYIIACDGGLFHADKVNRAPDFILGDLDSVDKTLLKKYNNIEKQIFPSDKDYTDGELGLITAYEKGYKDIIFLGSLGGRIDHTLCNIFLLSKALEFNIDAKIYDEKEKIYITNSTIRVNCEVNDTVSIIPIENIQNITTTALRYPLNNENLYVGNSRSLSNIANEKTIKIEMEKGKALVIISK